MINVGHECGGGIHDIHRKGKGLGSISVLRLDRPVTHFLLRPFLVRNTFCQINSDSGS